MYSVIRFQPEESPPIDDVPGMAAAGLQLHQAVLSEPGIEVECAPYQQKGRQDTECDAGPLSHSGHVHDYENHEHGEQSARKDKQVHTLQSFELRTAADSLVDRILRHNQRKNERKMVAATIRKIHAPNQLAAVFEVSGSPDENFE